MTTCSVSMSTSFVVWLLVFVTSAADGSSSRSYGPRVKTMDDQCYSQNHCDTGLGQACIWRFEGCDHGHCMCNPSRPFLDRTTGKCVRGLLEGDDCRAGEKRCPHGMDCVKGQCRCTEGKPSKDREACHKSTDRLLGHTCRHGDDCWQKHPSGPGYTQNNVMCMEGRCRCEPGLKEEGQHCHKRKIGDECKQDKHCTGDALCLTDRCTCLHGYRAVAGGTKCAPLGATVDQSLGEPCNEQEQRAFCAAGLVCHRCRSDGPYQCLRPVHQGSAAAYYNSAPRHMSLVILVILCLLSLILTHHYR